MALLPNDLDEYSSFFHWLQRECDGGVRKVKLSVKETMFLFAMKFLIIRNKKAQKFIICQSIMVYKLKFSGGLVKRCAIVKLQRKVTIVVLSTTKPQHVPSTMLGIFL